MVSKAFFGAEDSLNEPFVRLLMLVRAVNEENVLEKKLKKRLDIEQF